MTSEESFARLDAIRAEKYPYEERDREEWRANADNPKKRAEISRRRSDWIEAQDRRENEAIKALIPRVGLPCTVYYYTDRHAATITKILSPSKVVVQDNLVECEDFYSGKYIILPELEPGEQVFTKRRNGMWILEGHPTKDGVRLLLHYQSHYIDPHF